MKAGQAMKVAAREDLSKQRPATVLPTEPMTGPTGESTLYVYGKSLVARKDSSGISYHHQDFLSSNRFSTDVNGKLISRNVQDPYGKDVEEYGYRTALDNDYKFTGKEQDGDLYYYGARYYQPSTGRFISPDPLITPDSAFAYASNNPLRFADPTGMRSEDVQRIDILPDDFIGPLAQNQMTMSEVKAWNNPQNEIWIDPVTGGYVPASEFQDIPSMDPGLIDLAELPADLLTGGGAAGVKLAMAGGLFVTKAAGKKVAKEVVEEAVEEAGESIVNRLTSAERAEIIKKGLSISRKGNRKQIQRELKKAELELKKLGSGHHGVWDPVRNEWATDPRTSKIITLQTSPMDWGNAGDNMGKAVRRYLARVGS